jgi:hypothetical protein
MDYPFGRPSSQEKYPDISTCYSKKIILTSWPEAWHKSCPSNVQLKET